MTSTPPSTPIDCSKQKGSSLRMAVIHSRWRRAASGDSSTATHARSLPSTLRGLSGQHSPIGSGSREGRSRSSETRARLCFSSFRWIQASTSPLMATTLAEQLRGLGEHHSRYWRATGCKLEALEGWKVRAFCKTGCWTWEVPEDKRHLTPCQFTTYLIASTLRARGALT